ncbi:MAG: peptidylprolyl isomerase [Flavobacteriales bacterium]
MKKLIVILFFIPLLANAQGELIDKIVAVVGDEIVLHSDIQSTILEATQGKTADATAEERCSVVENLLYQKLLLNQSKIDSIDVSDAEVQMQVDRRLNYFIQMFGSTEQFEAYYGKTTAQMKADYFDLIKDQLLVQRMQSEITKDLKVTPSDVLKYFNSLPPDSLPLVGEQIRYSQIVIDPEVRESERQRTIMFLDSIRNDILNGRTSMTLQAAKWSEDPGSKYKGGCYPLQRKGSFVPEYEAAVSNTPEGSYSPVFKTDYGYHFVKVVEKRGDFYESCHILMSPKVSENDLSGAKTKLDSIASALNAGKITFQQAALRYSTDKNTANQEGRVANIQSGSKHNVAELSPETNLILSALKVGEVSEPVLVKKQDGSQAYVVYRLDERIPAHRATMEQDFEIFKYGAEDSASRKIMDEWVNKKIASTYVSIDPEFASCVFEFNWIKN